MKLLKDWVSLEPNVQPPLSELRSLTAQQDESLDRVLRMERDGSETEAVTRVWQERLQAEGGVQRAASYLQEELQPGALGGLWGGVDNAEAVRALEVFEAVFGIREPNRERLMTAIFRRDPVSAAEYKEFAAHVAQAKESTTRRRELLAYLDRFRPIDLDDATRVPDERPVLSEEFLAGVGDEKFIVDPIGDEVLRNAGPGWLHGRRFEAVFAFPDLRNPPPHPETRVAFLPRGMTLRETRSPQGQVQVQLLDATGLEWPIEYLEKPYKQGEMAATAALRHDTTQIAPGGLTVGELFDRAEFRLNQQAPTADPIAGAARQALPAFERVLSEVQAGTSQWIRRLKQK